MNQRTDLVSKAFGGLLVANTVLLLLPLWQGGRIAQMMDIEILNFWAIRITRFINLFFFLIILSSAKPQSTSLFNNIIIIFGLMMLSMIINFDLSQITTALEFFIADVALFCCIREIRISNNVIKYITLAFILWSIVPVLYFPVAPDSQKLAMFATDPLANKISSTFCGFAMHRNAYAFIAGISVLLLLFSDIKIIFKVLSIVILSIGLFLSASRGAIVAVALCVVYYFLKGTSFRKKIIVAIFIGVAFYLFLYYGRITESRIVDNEGTGREIVYSVAWGRIMESPLLGYGQNVMLDIGHWDGELSPAHNFILQTWLDYGVFALLAFIVFIIQLYRLSCHRSRTILLFLLIIGFVQPYFSLTAPAQYILITYLFIIFFNLTEIKESKELLTSHNV